jgi:hypothetical protein
MGERQVSVLLLISILIVGCFAILMTVNKVSAQFTPPPGWSSYKEYLIPSRMDGLAVENEPVEVDLNPGPGECYSMDEIRVIAPDGVTEIPRQVFDIERQAIKGYITSCKVAFLVDAPADTNVTYYTIYNNPGAGTPVYDGLRLYEEAAGDTYNITAVQGATEKNYARIFWKSLLDLYSNGAPVTWPGGPSGWEFSQINLGTMWSDAWGNAWFGAGKALSLLESGPIFAEFNYSEAYATDLWGMFMDFNVSSSMILRVYYQPDLNPLMKFDKTYNIVTNLANYTISPGAFLDFRLANSTSLAIYSDFTYSEGWFGTTVVPVETSVWKTIWYDPWAVYGWWSYNGSRTDSTDKPASNIGMIPTYSGGTVPVTPDGEYGLSVIQQIQDDDHHCTQLMNGQYNGTPGDFVRVDTYLFTYGLDVPAELAMNTEATLLRNPLGVSVGLGTRNIAISSMTVSKTVVGVGFDLVINLTISNGGVFPECFCIELDANATAAWTTKIYGIAPGESKTITIVLNTTGFAKGNYTLAASTGIVPNESNTSDNALVDGQIKIGFPGDVNADGTVDIYDAILLANAFSSTPVKPNWNTNADINGDNVVDIFDAILLASNFNKKE